MEETTQPRKPLPDLLATFTRCCTNTCRISQSTTVSWCFIRCYAETDAGELSSRPSLYRNAPSL